MANEPLVACKKWRIEHAQLGVVIHKTKMRYTLSFLVGFILRVEKSRRFSVMFVGDSVKTLVPSLFKTNSPFGLLIINPLFGLLLETLTNQVFDLNRSRSRCLKCRGWSTKWSGRA